MRTCTKCEKTSLEVPFYKTGSYCASCQREATRDCRLKKIGMTRQEYDDKVKEHLGGCEICGAQEQEPGVKRPLHVDHDHLTLKPRGVICIRCNLVLGYVKDDHKLLGKMMWYLMKYRTANSCMASVIDEMHSDTTSV